MFGLTKGPNGETNYVRMLDDFKMGPNLVRGFQPAGLGPRDLTPGTSGDALGGTYYWGASLEVQYPFYFLPKDAGFRASLIWDSPFDPLLFDFAYPILKQPYDRVQWFQFGGGTRF